MTGKSNEIAKLRADLADARKKITDCVRVMDEQGARILALTNLPPDPWLPGAIIRAAQLGANHDEACVTYYVDDLKPCDCDCALECRERVKAITNILAIMLKEKP